MNNHRRKKIEKIIDEINAQIEDLEQVRDEEEESYENIPESLKYSERGEKMSEIIDIMDEVIGNISDHIDQLQEILLS